MVEYLHSSQPARGIDRVRIPGEPEQEALAARSAAGVPIDDNSWESLLKAARTAGLSDGGIAALIPGA